MVNMEDMEDTVRVVGVVVVMATEETFMVVVGVVVLDEDTMEMVMVIGVDTIVVMEAVGVGTVMGLVTSVMDLCTEHIQHCLS